MGHFFSSNFAPPQCHEPTFSILAVKCHCRCTTFLFGAAQFSAYVSFIYRIVHHTPYCSGHRFAIRKKWLPSC